jgi:hypothetical protein
VSDASLLVLLYFVPPGRDLCRAILSPARSRAYVFRPPVLRSVNRRVYFGCRLSRDNGRPRVPFSLVYKSCTCKYHVPITLINARIVQFGSPPYRRRPPHVRTWCRRVVDLFVIFDDSASFAITPAVSSPSQTNHITTIVLSSDNPVIRSYTRYHLFIIIIIFIRHIFDVLL